MAINKMIDINKMRHAVLILAHNKPEQIRKLVDSLDGGCFDFYIHVDGKRDLAPFRSQFRKNRENIHLIGDDIRVNVYLNDFSLVDATCILLQEAYSKGEYVYYILLTGQDYPIKSNGYIKNFLDANYPTMFIDSYGIEEGKKNGIKWVDSVGRSQFSQKMRRNILNMVGRRMYYSSYGKIFKIIPRLYDLIMTERHGVPYDIIKNNTEYTYSVGSHFWMLPDVAVSHILEVYEHDSFINDIFRHTAAPEESYFQTVLTTMDRDVPIPDPWSQFASMEAEMDNPARRLIKWYENGIHTSGHPSIWKKTDFEFIERAKALFARKFDKDVDNEIIEMIDTRLR